MSADDPAARSVSSQRPPRRAARRRAAAVGLLALTLLAACGGPGGSAGGGAGGGGGDGDGVAGSSATASRVDVDTPSLRALKQRAGIEGCPATRVSSASSGTSDLPRVSLPCLGGGRAVDLHGLGGPTVINLFAQWCGPCRSELPYYQRLHTEGRGAVSVLGIDYLDTQPSRALELARDTGVTYPLLADPDGDLRADFGVRFLPGIVFVGRDGSVHVQFTLVRSYAQLRDLVSRRLGVRLAS